MTFSADAVHSSWLRRLFPPRPGQTDPFAARKTTALTASLPTAQDGIAFDATVYCIWEASYGPGQLADLITRQQPAVELDIRQQLRIFAHVYQPERAGDAERELTQQLRQAPAVVEPHGQCRPWLVTLDSDPVVRQQRQREWAVESEAQQRHRRAVTRITEIDQLRLAWEHFLDAADEGSKRTAEAVRLALRPEDAPDVVLEAASRHQDTIEGLQALCDRAIEVHRQQDVYDFVVSFDSALRNLMNHLDRPSPIDAEWQELLDSNGPPAGQPNT
jgi:hypothetical protein